MPGSLQWASSQSHDPIGIVGNRGSIDVRGERLNPGPPHFFDQD